MMLIPSLRSVFLLIFLGCTGLMLTGYYMQYVMGLQPCALCMTQRVFIVAVGLVALLAWGVNAKGLLRRVLASLGMLFAVAGGYFSSRQLYLQSLPEDQVPACGPSIDYLLDNFPIMEALEVMLRGDGNCAEVAWSFLGLSIPAWTLVAFAGLFVLNFWQCLRKVSV